MLIAGLTTDANRAANPTPHRRTHGHHAVLIAGRNPC